MMRKKIVMVSVLSCIMTVSALNISALAQPWDYSISGSLNAASSTATEQTIDLNYGYEGLGGLSGFSPITAVYDEEGNLFNIGMGNILNKESQYSIKVPTDGKYSVKSFLWNLDDLSNYNPAVELSDAELADMTTVLKWDFEDDSDFATEFTEEAGKTTTTPELNKWMFATVNTDKGNLRPTIKNTALSDVSQSTDGLGYYLRWKGVNIKADGSTSCMEINRNKNEDKWVKGTGIKVRVSDKQLVPGHKYVMSFYATNGGGTYGIAARTGCPEWQWNQNWVGDDIKDAIDNSTYIPDAYSTNLWEKSQLILEPKPEDYVDGHTYISLVFVPYDNVTNYNDKITFYMDDIEIKEIKTDGKLSWNFENNDGISDGDEIGKWTYTTWLSNGDDDADANANTAIMPTTVEVASAEKLSTQFFTKYPNSEFKVPDSDTDNISADSDTCARIFNDMSVQEKWIKNMGMKVKLTKDQLVPGKTYKMSFYTLTDVKTMNGYVGLQKVETRPNKKGYNDWSWAGGDWLQEYYNGYIKCTQHVGFVQEKMKAGADGNYGADFQIQKHWERHEVEITPQDSDFDANGFTHLWLTFTESTTPNADGTYMFPGMSIYIDDISIEVVN